MTRQRFGPVLRLNNAMKKFLLLVLICAFCSPIFAQKVESIHFHLYTDSLKKGQHNYINVDGKLSNGKWTPLTAKDLDFTCAEAKFEGTELVIPENFAPLKVTVKATLKSNPSLVIERTIWIKQKPDPPLPTQEEVIRDYKRNQKNKRN